MEFIFGFLSILYFGLLAALELAWSAFRGRPALETCLYARFLLDRFCAGYDSASQAGGGTEEPIYSQALLLEPRHGLPSAPASNRFAIRGSNKFRETREDTSHGPIGRLVVNACDDDRPQAGDCNFLGFGLIRKSQSDVDFGRERPMNGTSGRDFH